MITETLMATVSTDCQCDYFDEETQTYLPSDECFGDCYEWQKEDVFHLLGEWKTANGIDDYDPILIECNAIGWDKRSGYKFVEMINLDGALSINGDFRIEWYLNNDVLTARRYSHDEPVGSGLFTFTPCLSCDKCGEPIKKDVYTEELGMCLECSNRYFDHSDEE